MIILTCRTTILKYLLIFKRTLMINYIHKEVVTQSCRVSNNHLLFLIISFLWYLPEQDINSLLFTSQPKLHLFVPEKDKKKVRFSLIAIVSCMVYNFIQSLILNSCSNFLLENFRIYMHMRGCNLRLLCYI